MQLQWNFALLTDTFIVSSSKLLILSIDLKCKRSKHKTAFKARNIFGTFEERATDPQFQVKFLHNNRVRSAKGKFVHNVIMSKVS